MCFFLLEIYDELIELLKFIARINFVWSFLSDGELGSVRGQPTSFEPVRFGGLTGRSRAILSLRSRAVVSVLGCLDSGDSMSRQVLSF